MHISEHPGRQAFLFVRMVGILELKRIELQDPENNRVLVENAAANLDSATGAIVNNEKAILDEFVERICQVMALVLRDIDGGGEASASLATALLQAKGRDPLLELCKTVEASAIEIAYGDSTRSIEFFPVPTDLAEVHAFTTDIQVSGKTYAVEGAAEIQIDFGKLRPGFKEICALPYVISHEVVSHALAHDAAIEGSGSFQDGWMDVIAMAVHRQLLEAWEPADVANCILDLPERVREHSEALHSARYAASGKMQTGRDAAERLARSIRNRGYPESLLLSVSTTLNQSPLSARDRDAVAEVVGSQRRLPSRELDAMVVELGDDSTPVGSRVAAFVAKVLERRYL